MKCRFCGNELKHIFLDLNNSPPSNSFLNKEDLNKAEVYYPLKLFVCENCFLVQLDEYKKADEIFNSEYIYFSSFSTSWLRHCEIYAGKVVDRFKMNNKSLVIEIASNDGYLLQFFKEKGINVLGIEPTKNTAEVALQKGINTEVRFFGEAFAKELLSRNKKADLLIGNNVLAHVPDINDFVKGLKIILKDDGVITMEFPHLLKLVEECQFDTVYHEHFSYLSFTTLIMIFNEHGLDLFDVEEIPTHGGSLRIYAQHREFQSARPAAKSVDRLLKTEKDAGITDLKFYGGFQERVNKIKLSLLEFLINQKLKGARVAAYGAAAKGNTLLNFCGIKNDLIEFVTDASPYKQNKFLPGSHIPVLTEEELKKQKPEYIFILPWNIKEEILNQLSYVKDWNGKFVTAIPELKIIKS